MLSGTRPFLRRFAVIVMMAAAVAFTLQGLFVATSEAATGDTHLVLEISNRHLKMLHRSPAVAVLTNVYPNHLDEHGGWDGYVEAKSGMVRYQREGQVAVAFFGDGASNQAYFHECLNMARVFSLPAVFVCENNFYGEFTPMATVTAGVDIAGRAVRP